MRIIQNPKLDFSDVLIVPKRSTLSSRKDVNLARTYIFLNSKIAWTGIPIIASNMDTVGTIETANVLGNYHMMTWLHKYTTRKDLNKCSVASHYVAITLGEDIEKAIEGWWIPQIVRLDVANGYREEFIDHVKKVREKLPNTIIFAGNVCTPEVTEQLLLAGADVVVVGIGSGGQCTTRIKTGIGYPQLSGIIECADAAHGIGGHIVSDGGCNEPSDVVKAFGAGADFVCLGSMLAAHKENTLKENIEQRIEGELIAIPGAGNMKMPNYVNYAKVYGMSSKDAMDKYHGGIEEHRAAEGKTSLIKLRGSLHDTIKDILGGLRSACTYVGAKSLKELTKRTTFVIVNQTHNRYYEKPNT